MARYSIMESAVDAIAAEMAAYAEGCQKRGLKGVATRVRDWAERLEEL
jgi:hypothetical protein